MVAIVGPNGAGKTTLMSAVMGLLPRRGGSVRYRGAPRRRDRGPGRRRRHPGAGTARPVHRHERRGQPAAGLLPPTPRRRTRCRPVDARGVRDLPAAGGAPAPACRDAVGRRAADARSGPRADGPASAVTAGRAQPGPRAVAGAGDLPGAGGVAPRRVFDFAGGAERSGGAAGFRLRLCAGDGRGRGRRSGRRAGAGSSGVGDVSGAAARNRASKGPFVAETAPFPVRWAPSAGPTDQQRIEPLLLRRHADRCGRPSRPASRWTPAPSTRNRSGLSSISRAVFSSDRVAAASSWRRIRLAFAVRSASTTLLTSSRISPGRITSFTPRSITSMPSLAQPRADEVAQLLRPERPARGQHLVQRPARDRFTDRELDQPIQPRIAHRRPTAPARSGSTIRRNAVKSHAQPRCGPWSASPAR